MEELRVFLNKSKWEPDSVFYCFILLTVNTWIMSGTSGEHIHPSIQSRTQPPIDQCFTLFLFLDSLWHFQLRAHHYLAEEALQRVPSPVGGGGLRRRLQAGHGSRRPTAMVQPHTLHEVKQDLKIDCGTFMSSSDTISESVGWHFHFHNQ